MIKPQLIKPKRHISERVPKTGGIPPDQAIIRALNAAHELTTGYQGWAVDDLQDLWNLFLETEHSDGTIPDMTIKMFDVCHEIRGQGGTFGFPLISIIGDSLCKFLDKKECLSKKELGVVRIHILSLKAVFRQKLKGSQGSLSDTIRELLVALRAKVDPDTQ